MALALANRTPLFFPVLLVAIGAGALYYGQYRSYERSNATAPYSQSVVDPQVSASDPANAVDPLQNQSLLAPAADGPRVQIAILLDTSSSMSGLIDQARSELWRMVNTLDDFSKDGTRSQIEIAVYEYGNSGLSDESGYLRQVIGFSSDLDAISEGLFSLSTNGGSEHTGQVIDAAHHALQWRADDDTVRAIYIAGNESFEQGPTPFAEAISDARASGITVNTVYCGAENQGRQEGWAQGAKIGGGRFMAIDHNAISVHIETPQDAKIAQLGQELNDTYVYYGQRGASSHANQARQDNNAASAGIGSLIERSVSKSGRAYNNYSWDLVDATAQGQIDLRSIDQQTLPLGYRDLDTQQLKAKVEAQAERRKSLQKQLASLQAQREAFLAAKKREGQDAANTLDSAMIDSLKAQALGLGFEVQ